MIAYRTLSDVPLETIHRCFVDAFSDYQVKMDLPFEKLRLMLGRRGFDPGLSVGAFDNGVLVGIILNGRREWNGKDTLYDTGTGVVPNYRRQGITRAMFQEVLNLAAGSGLRQYLLEVIRTNTPAVELYRKQGFEITRTFGCHKAPKTDTVEGMGGHEQELTRADELDWDWVQSLWDFRPSWQNSIASVLAVPAAFAAVVAKSGGQPVGYGIVEKRTGDIPQVAVAKPFRGRGIGRAILEGLAAQCEAPNLVMVNVEDGHPAMEAFLGRTGFSPFVGQYEMVFGL